MSIVLCAIVAVAVWPRYVERSTNVAAAASLPTMAPVVADYQTRDKMWRSGRRRKTNIIPAI